MSRRKKRLPKNFEDLLADGDLSALQAVFDDRLLDARGGYAKQTALAFDECPDELARWLVTQGADLEATDERGNTPLHTRARSSQGRIGVLLELGADVRASGAPVGTPLHAAASSRIIDAAAQLLESGADVDATDQQGRTPLELALARCTNIDLEYTAPLAQLLLDAGATRTAAMAASVEEIGTRFEFHRDGLADGLAEPAGAALDTLYRMFDVTPVPRRRRHDGVSPIVVTATRWQDQHAELWDLLVPSSGAAATVQGEVVRIAGRISDELDRNGGVNWDDHHRAMARAFLGHVGTGTALVDEELADARTIVDDLLRGRPADTRRLAELGVTWVRDNPGPVPLGEPAYRR